MISSEELLKGLKRRGPLKRGLHIHTTDNVNSKEDYVKAIENYLVWLWDLRSMPDETRPLVDVGLCYQQYLDIINW